MATITIYNNKSGHNVLNKNLEKVRDITGVEYIQPVNLMQPRFILKPDSRVVEGQIIYTEQFAKYYEVLSVTAEHNRFIVECKEDLLSTFLAEIMELDNIILERITANSKEKSSSQLANFYLEDNEIDVLSYPFIETHYLTAISGTQFSNQKNEFILGITGGVTASE